MTKNNLLEKLLKETLDEMMNEAPSVDLSSIVGDDDEFDYDSLFDNDEDEDSLDMSSVFDDDDDEEEYYVGNTPTRAMGGGLTKATDYQKGKNSYRSVIRDRGSKNFANAIQNSAIKDYFTNIDSKNPYNKLERDSNDKDQFGRVKVQYTVKNSKYYKNGKIALISLFNIHPNDVRQLCATLANSNNTEHADIAATRQNHGKDGITFIVYFDKIENWKNTELPYIVDFLASKKTKSGKPVYGDEEQMQNLKTMLETRIYTQQDLDADFNQSEKNNLERFAEYLSSEDNETINAIIDIYSRYNILNSICRDLKLPESYGHILSWKNAKAIIGSNRNLTFILPEKTWRRDFGRILKPNAQPVFVSIPNNRNWKGKWKNPTPIEHTFIDPRDGKPKTIKLQSTEDILNAFYDGKNYEELSTQQQYRVNTLANHLNVKDTFRIPEYDISDTVWDPNLNPVDVFNETIGLENNLKGIPNEKAREELKQHELKQKETDTIEGDGPSVEDRDAEVDLMLKRTEYALKNVSLYAKKHGIHVNEGSGNDSLALINTLLNIAKKHIPQEIGITKDNFVKELAENAVYFVCRLERIALDYINSFRHVQKVDANALSTFSSIIDILINAIERPQTEKKEYKTALEENEEIQGNEDIILGNFSNNPELVNKKIMAFVDKLNKEAYKEEQKIINENFFITLDKWETSRNNLL